MRAGRKNPDETRRQLLGAADRAFYGDGIRNASVDDIAEQAGVTKRTLYYHYGSKEDLVVAYLEARGERTLRQLLGGADNTGGNFAQRMDKLFALLARAPEHAGWNGCPFARAAAEFVDAPEHGALRVARNQKLAFEQSLRNRAEAAGYRNPRTVARTLAVLIDGAVTQMMIHRDGSYAQAAKAAASLVLAEARSKTPRLRTPQRARAIRSTT